MSFPTIPTAGAGTIVSQLNTAGGATKTFTNILNGLTKNSGDLLIAICVIYDGNSTNAEFSSWTAGWTEFGDIATTTTMGIGAAYKFSDGTESGNLAVTTADTSANDSAMIVMAIPGAHASSPPEIGGTSSGTTSTATPNSLNPAGWDAEDTLWIAVCGCGEDATTGSFTGITTVPPTNYSNQLNTGISADVVGGIEAAVAFRQLNAASEDPGNFGNDSSNARWRCCTIAVRPAAPVTETPTPGGAIAGGNAATVNVAVAQGGALAGGVAPSAPLFETPTPGGALAGGAAPLAKTSVAAGGGTGQGLAPLARITMSQGGALAQGTVPLSQASVTASGALAQGNAATVNVTFTVGGAVAGGFSPAESGGISETPTLGGAIAGGFGPAAAVAFSPGGATAGGLAPGQAGPVVFITGFFGRRRPQGGVGAGTPSGGLGIGVPTGDVFDDPDPGQR